MKILLLILSTAWTKWPEKYVLPFDMVVWSTLSNGSNWFYYSSIINDTHKGSPSMHKDTLPDQDCNIDDKNESMSQWWWCHHRQQMSNWFGILRTFKLDFDGTAKIGYVPWFMFHTYWVGLTQGKPVLGRAHEVAVTSWQQKGSASGCLDAVRQS